MNKYALLLGASAGSLLIFSAPSFAQSTAQPVLPGTLGTSGCPSPALSPCYQPYTNSNPLPVSVQGGTSSSNVTVVAPLGSQPAASSVSVAVASDQINLPIPAGTNLIGKVGIDQTTPGTTNGVQTVPGANSGLSMSTITATASTNATVLKNAAGNLYHISGYSAAAIPTWMEFFNTSSTPNCTVSIVYEILIPVNSTSGGGFIEDIPEGLTFTAGISYCMTTGIGGTGNVSASVIVANFGYK